MTRRMVGNATRPAAVHAILPPLPHPPPVPGPEEELTVRPICSPGFRHSARPAFSRVTPLILKIPCSSVADCRPTRGSLCAHSPGAVTCRCLPYEREVAIHVLSVFGIA